MPVAVLLALAVTISLGMTSWLVWRLLRGQSGVIQGRLEAYASRGQVVEEIRPKRAGMLAEIDRGLRKNRFGQRWAEELSKADLPWRLSEFVMLCISLSLLCFLVGVLLFDTPVLGLITGIVGLVLPRYYVRKKQTGRIRAFNDQIGDALSLVVSSLRSGYSMLQSMEVVSSELPDPIGKEFGRVVREISLGLSMEQAMRNMLKRVPSEDMDMVVTVINVQHEVGGNLAEVLDTISETIRERVRIKGEIRVMTAQQQYTGYLLICLPFAITLLLYMINRTYMSALFEDICGIIAAGVGLLMVAMGFLIMRKIVNIKI